MTTPNRVVHLVPTKGAAIFLHTFVRVNPLPVRPATLHIFLWLVAAGSVLLVPSLVLLFRVFKGKTYSES